MSSDVPSPHVEQAARMAMAGIHREYPNQMALVLHSDADARPPRESTPAFFGCYDWHSAVHGHWCLVRLLRLFPAAPWTAEAISALTKNLSADNIAAEVTYLSGPGREGFERPYGLAWLLQLAAELREWNDPTAVRWLQNIIPLERLAVERLSTWLPRLTHPIRSGEHSQTAFAMGLALDRAVTAGDESFVALLKTRTLGFHRHDRNGPLDYEPSGHDFLSPCLAEADLMRRVLQPVEFAEWLDSFLPRIPCKPTGEWLQAVSPPGVNDGKLAHLDGLNLSRAWMLKGIAAGLPASDPRISALEAAAAEHREAGFGALATDNYSSSHWIGSFAVYLLTDRGLACA